MSLFVVIVVQIITKGEGNMILLINCCGLIERITKITFHYNCIHRYIYATLSICLMCYIFIRVAMSNIL